MTAVANPFTTTLRASVARQFASRPTLREVLAKGAYRAMTSRYPKLAVALPETTSAEGFTFTLPVEEDQVRLNSLVEALLETFRQGQAVAFDTHNHLSLQPPAGPTADVTEDPALAGVRIDLAALNPDFNHLLQTLIERFKRAQADYWNARDASGPQDPGIERHRWMAQTLRLAALSDDSVTNLDEDERSCLLDFLAGDVLAPATFAVEMTLLTGNKTARFLNAEFLITAERDERQVVLWCRAGGAVRGFASLQAFGQALMDYYGERYQFEAMTWNRYPIASDAFLRWSALMLSDVLSDVSRVAVEDIASVGQMELAFAQLTDPSRYFLATPMGQVNADAVPDWLASASSEDRFEYRTALNDVAVQQARAQGRTSLDDVDDLHGYAARRLREQLLADYPTEANYFPDDLILTVSVPDPLRDKELPISLVEYGQMTLTELAIGNLDALRGGVVSAITHRTDQLIMDWMNPTYITRLIQTVDVGGEYPKYLDAQLGDPARLGERIDCFAGEWRASLQFAALDAKVGGQLDREGWQGVVEFCRSGLEYTANVEFAPLAFRLADGRGAPSLVSGMYVITLKQPATVLLYRPLLAQASLRQFRDLSQLMAALDQAGELQSSVLQWLQPSSNYIGSDGGRLKAHPDWLAESSADPYLLPSLSVAVVLDIQPWKEGLTSMLFASKRQIMLDLADRQSVSNAEQRWADIRKFSWLLFNLIAPVLPGPVAAVAWLLTGLVSVLEDVKALQSDDKGQKAMAVADLISNFSMLLMHQRLPEPVMPALASPRVPVRLRRVPMRKEYLPGPTRLLQGVVEAPEALARRNANVVVNHGWGPAPQALSKALAPLASQVDLERAMPANGLELLDGKFYVRLFDRVFEVTHDGNERRIIGPDGSTGPYLRDDGTWSVVTGFALGGGPKRPSAVSRQRRYDTSAARLGELIQQLNALQLEAAPLAEAEVEREIELERLHTSRASALANEGTKFTTEQVQKLVKHYDEKIPLKQSECAAATAAYVDKLEALVDTDLAIQDTATELQDLRRTTQVVARADGAVLETSRELSRVGLVRSNWLIVSRLYNRIDYQALQQAGQALAGRPVSEVLNEYLAYKDRLKETVVQQARLIKCNAVLDQQLAVLPPDTEIFPATADRPALTVAAIIEQRVLTTVDMHFQQVLYCFDLSLHMQMPDPSRKLPAFFQALMGPRLRMAASNHGAVLSSNLSAADRLYLLQTAWSEYSKAIVSSVEIAREGGPLVDTAYLARYKSHLEHLKKSINELIVPVVAQMDGRLDNTRAVYRVAPPQQAVANTRDGQDVIGVEVEEEGLRRLEVRGALDQQLLARFEWQDETWVQDFPVVPEITEPVPGAAQEQTLRSLSALVANTATKASADRYIAERGPFGPLAGLIDEQVHKLQALSQVLPDDGPASTRQVRKALDEWPALRTELLKRLCYKTQFPEADALRFMHDQKLLRVTSTGARFTTRDGTGTDEYKIELLEKPGDKKSVARWYAHFHFAHQADVATAFTSGHLKTEAQRYFGADDARRLAERGERIHRGKLTLAQAQGIIPFY